jgi:hypothetical protein
LCEADCLIDYCKSQNLLLPFNEKLLNNLRPTQAKSIIMEQARVSKQILTLNVHYIRGVLISLLCILGSFKAALN